MGWISDFNQFIGAGTVIGQIAVIVFLVVLFVPAAGRSALGKWLGRNGLRIAFAVSAIATVGSLTYSNIIGFPPCDLCWFQRIFIYPQVIILGLTLWRRDSSGAWYGLAVAIPGLLVSLYHNYIYYGGSSILPCSAAGLSTSCTQRFVDAFGYVTIPLMALATLSLIIVSLAAYLKNQASK